MNDDELTHWEGLPPTEIGALSHVQETPPRRWLREEPGPEQPNAANAPSQALAIERDLSDGAIFPLAELWGRLRTAEWRVRDTFAGARRLYVIVEEATNGRRRRPNNGGMAMIEQVLLGQSAKAVAIDRDVADSTVALAIKNRLQLMGLTCKLRALPLILVLAARAAHSPELSPVIGHIAQLPSETSVRRWVVSVQRPSFRLPERLSAAERCVLLQVLDGKTYVQIARFRSTSTRTVANQLGAVFRKLSVSGFGETLDLLMTQALRAGVGEPA